MAAESEPKNTDWAASGVESIEKIMSHSAMTSKGVEATRGMVEGGGKAALRGAVLSERFQARRSGNALDRLESMGRPMTPRPINPIFGEVGGVAEHCKRERVRTEGWRRVKVGEARRRVKKEVGVAIGRKAIVSLISNQLCS